MGSGEEWSAEKRDFFKPLDYHHPGPTLKCLPASQMAERKEINVVCALSSALLSLCDCELTKTEFGDGL